VLDFNEVKKVRITDVVGRYGIRLRFKGEWASAPCPLPTHKAGDKGRNFTINIPQNYWRCFSASCNEKNEGRRGGDVINFVALMENCRGRDAAQKIADWFSVNGKTAVCKPPTKTAPQIEARPERSESTPHKDSPDHNPQSDSGKGTSTM
jgi:DNA primase